MSSVAHIPGPMHHFTNFYDYIFFNWFLSSHRLRYVWHMWRACVRKPVCMRVGTICVDVETGVDGNLLSLIY